MTVQTVRIRGTVTIQGLGLASSLAADVKVACAAARAGIVRPTPLDYSVVDEDTGDVLPVTGHIVRGFTDGFVGVGRLIRLGAMALADLLRQNNLSRMIEGRNTGIFIHLSHQGYEDLYLERILKPMINNKLAFREAQRQFSADRLLQRRQIKTLLIPGLLDVCGLQIPVECHNYSFGGTADFIETLHQAIQSLQRGTFDCCIVGAIDSLTDWQTLEQLDKLRLLHSVANPVGFSPGEGAAFLVLKTVRSRHGEGDATIEALAFSRDAAEEATGQLLAEVFKASTSYLPRPELFPRIVIQNMNGEHRRAMEFATARVRLTGPDVRWPLDAWYPASSFGEVGVATGAFAICMACRAFSRRYSQGEHLLIWLTSEDAQRAALLLGHPVAT